MQLFMCKDIMKIMFAPDNIYIYKTFLFLDISTKNQNLKGQSDLKKKKVRTNMAASDAFAWFTYNDVRTNMAASDTFAWFTYNDVRTNMAAFIAKGNMSSSHRNSANTIFQISCCHLEIITKYCCPLIGQCTHMVYNTSLNFHYVLF